MGFMSPLDFSFVVFYGVSEEEKRGRWLDSLECSFIMGFTVLEYVCVCVCANVSTQTLVPDSDISQLSTAF